MNSSINLINYAFYKTSLKKTTVIRLRWDKARHGFWKAGLTERLFISRYSTSSTESLVRSAMAFSGIVRFSDDRLQDKAVSDIASLMMSQMPNINHYSPQEIPENDFHQAKYVDLFKQFPLILDQCRLCTQGGVVSFAEFLIQCYVTRVECL